MPLRTFADWYKILNNIASCPYWKAFKKLDEPGVVLPTPKPSMTAQTNTEPICTSDASVDAKCDMSTDAFTVSWGKGEQNTLYHHFILH